MGTIKYDAFGDVRASTDGVFGAEQAALQPGLKKHQSVHSQATPTGVVMQFECQVCGQPTLMTIEYPEMVALKYGVNPMIAFRGRGDILKHPTRWEYNPADNGWVPDAACPNCQAKQRDLCIEPHEPELLLAAARRRGYINKTGEAVVSQVCAQAAEAGRAVRR